MKLQEYFPAEFKAIKNPNVIRILRDLEVFDFTDSYGVFDPIQTLFVGSGVATAEVLSLFSRLRVNHFVDLFPGNLVRSLVTGAGILRTPGKFISSPLNFILPQLDTAEAKPSAALRNLPVPFQSSLDRTSVLSRVGEFLEADRTTKGALGPALTIADELLANALRSTIDENGRRKYPANSSSTSELTMGADRHGRLFVAHDLTHLVVGCEDPYGSLDPNTFLDLLLETFDPNQQSEGTTTTQALGCKLMIDHSYEFIVVSRRNIKTVVCCVLRLGQAHDQHRGRSKNFHFHFF